MAEPATNEELDRIKNWRFEPGEETRLVRALEARLAIAESTLARARERIQEHIRRFKAIRHESIVHGLQLALSALDAKETT